MFDKDTKEILTTAAAEGAKAFSSEAFEFIKTILGGKIVGPPASVLGEVLGDYARAFRLKNFLKIRDGVEKELRARGISDTRQIPPAIAFPLIADATIQDDEGLQEKWSNLIANAMDPNFESQINRIHIDKLARLIPEGAVILELMQYGFESRDLPMHECRFYVSNLLKDAGYIEEDACKNDGSFITTGKGMDGIYNLIDLGLALPIVYDPDQIPYEKFPHALILGSEADIKMAEARQAQLISPQEITFTRVGYEFVKICSCSLPDKE